MALTLPQAEEHVQQCRDQLRQDPQNKDLQDNLASALCAELAPLLALAKRNAEAESAAREGIGITRGLLDPEPNQPRAQAYAFRIMEAASYLPPAEAVTETEVSVAVYRRLAAAHPDDSAQRGWLAQALAGRLGPRQWAAGQRDAAAASTREGLDLIRALADDPAVPSNNLRSYAGAFWRVAIYLPVEEMLAATAHAVTLYRRLAHPDPKSEHNRRDLYNALAVWAKRLTQAGRHSEAALVQRDADRAARYGEHALFGQDYRFPELAPIAVTSRGLGLDVFAVGTDGGMYSQWWAERWQDYFRIGTMSFQPRTPVTAESRTSDRLDVLAVAWDGLLRHASWNGEWDTRWLPIGDRTFPQLTPVAMVSRDAFSLDAFAVGGDGIVYGTAWNGDWQAWTPLPGPTFPQRAHVAALSRNSFTLDIWAVAEDRGVYWAWWFNGTWNPWERVGTMEFPAGSHVAAVSRQGNAMEVWLVDKDGRVYGNWWDDGDWHTWYPLGDKTFPVGTPLSAIERGPDYMEVHGVGSDNQLQYAWFDGSTWHSWFPVGSPDQQPKTFFPYGTPVTAHNRTLRPTLPYDVTDLFAVNADAGIHSVQNEWDDWKRAWFRLPVAVVRFQQPIESGGIAALGGWAGLTISIDGALQWYGHAHDSGADSYDFGVAFFVRTADNKALALFHNGDVSAGTRTEFWEEITPPNDLVLANLSDFIAGQDSMNMQYTSHFAETLEGSVSFAATWFVGDVVGPVVGGILFVGLEIESLISSGSLEPGAVRAAGVLWGAGLCNSLLAIAAGAVAEVGHRYRELHDNEWAVATSVFGGTLPPRDKILLTDTAAEEIKPGLRRPFTVPGLHGNVLLNFGAEGFDDPLGYYVGYESPTSKLPYKRGELLIHELTHAWQIRHTGFAPALLADSLSSATAGQDSYDYGPAGPEYDDFSLEGQAQLVSDWFGKHVVYVTEGGNGENKDKVTGLDSQEAINDPYFRYISGNIRPGVY